MIVLLAAMAAAAPLAAQHGSIGPPIDPNQALRAQPQPSTTLPPPTVTAPGAPQPPTVSRPIPQGRIVQDRAAYCQHMASVERVPRKRRGSYVQNCMRARD